VIVELVDCGRSDCGMKARVLTESRGRNRAYCSDSCRKIVWKRNKTARDRLWAEAIESLTEWTTP
jgi:hypothetical protein